ncbi:hypothetical protein MATL_G00060520 [Megalops atlanticus]|uniref:Uncharacterized protein n=1 Tax=Megalops atlanticus TaxID=7932 RepID=A0A9D3T9A2_MEGAT|nr:hypothetical protein MATL_G00060520 [Megalops atlanticus]
MSDSNQDEAAGNGEDTDELLCSDLDEEGRVSGTTAAQPPKDHCDLLLDAIDAQLSLLQAQSNAARARRNDGSYERTDHASTAPLSLSQSASKDTGLGSTIPANDTLTSHHDTVHSESQDLSSEKRSGNGGTSSGHEEDRTSTERAVTGEDEEGAASRQEQCRWRLERLLGPAEAGLESPLPHTADSVCTEDFAARFREEMVDPLVRVGHAEEESGSRTSGGELQLGPEGGSHSSEGAGGRDTAEGQGTKAQKDSGTDHGFVSEKMVVGGEGLEGLEGCHLGYHHAPYHNRNNLQSPGVFSSRAGQCQSAGRRDAQGGRDRGVRVADSGGERGSARGGASLHLHAQSRLGGSFCSQAMPAGGNTQLSGATDLDQMEVSRVQSSQWCEKPSVHPDPILNEGGRDGMTDATRKHGLDVPAERGNGSGIRMLTRSLSCPAVTPEARDGLRMTLDTDSMFIPSPTAVQLSHSPLKGTENSHFPLPSAAKSRAGQRRSCKDGGMSKHGQLWTHSTPLDCRSGDPSDAMNRTTPGPPNSSSNGVLTVSQSSGNTVEAEDDTRPTVHTTIRHLAGVPVKSFDSVTIDSDLDSVRTDRVRKHFQEAIRCRSAVRSARGVHLDDLTSDQSDLDTPVLEPRSNLSIRVSRGNVSSGGRSLRKPRHTRREAPDTVVGYACSDDEETDEVEEEEKGRASQRLLPGLDPRGLVQWNSAPRRRQSGWGRGAHLRTLTSGWLGEMDSDRMLLEEALSSLKQDCLKEEERLIQKRAQLCDTKLSLTALLQQKKHAMQELECVREAVDRAEREGQDLEASLRDSRAQADNTRSQLRMLQSQRDSCLKEMRHLEEELTVLRRHKAVLQERTGTEAERRQYGSSLSVLEREELDRQLDSAKAELFAEQRRARHRLDSLQESLEETQQELDQRMEEVRILKERCTGLEKQLTDAQRQREELEQRRKEEVEALEARVQELQGKAEEQGGRAGSLEHILAQKELQLLAAQEEKTAMQAERERLEVELHSLKEEHSAKLTETREQAQRDKELELQQLRSELSVAGEQEIQQIQRQAEKEKQEALRHQALSHTRHLDTLQTAMQLKEEELRTLKEALDQQEESMRKQALELQAEAQELAHQAVERELRRWEAEKEEELRGQREVLEEQSRQALDRVREEAEREKRNALALQNKVVELQTRLQELESEGRLQQREQAAALTAVRRALREDQQAELQRLRRHMEQEGQREVSRLQQALQQAEEETRALEAALAERGRSQEAGLAERTVQTLRAVREQLYTLVSHLQQEVDSQRHATQQLARDKERELRIQREQLALEREQALDSLKERLIQDHIEELSNLQRAQLRESSGGEAGGVAASLRRQLRDKDNELREVQRSMGRWKEQTAARLARKFEEELTAELERRAPKARMDQQRKLQRLESEVRRLTPGYSDSGGVRSVSSPSLLSVDPPATPGPPDLATFKLLRHLQSRVRQLRAENSVPTFSPMHLSTHVGTAGELAGSYLETIAPSPESCQGRGRSHIRTAHS